MLVSSATYLHQIFVGLPDFLFPWGFQSKAWLMTFLVGFCNFTKWGMFWSGNQ